MHRVDLEETLAQRGGARHALRVPAEVLAELERRLARVTLQPQGESCVRVRACRVSAWAPASRQRSAMPTGSRCASSQPLRILTVTGSCVALRTARMIACTRPRSLRHPDPPLFFTTFLTGHPKLMSMK